ncbi:ABC transporter permease [Pleionea litopenaei]|uniref:Transport permease protein n=1 Tax=Pleionea litopenaei TaxID=3070815 RepID=A0AA51RRF9_9GAMM|nr:ABC transporter permease [Pleionea sp. HL-JVS1]WMS86298.1 ABC transporter permease [Pleionea sp. HL-JVS1]
MKVNTMTIYWLETRSEFLKTIRVPAFAIPSLIFPLIFYVFFGLLFNQGGNQYPAYLMATYGVFGVIGPALFSFGVGVAIEKDQGWLALKQASPMPISAYFLARTLTAMAFALFIILSLFILAAVWGGVKLTLAQWTGTLLTLLLGSLPFAALGLWLGLKLKGQAAPAIVNLIYLPMAFLSGLWLPINLLPEIIQQIAWIFPAFHLAQLTLAIQQQSLGFDWYLHVGILLLMTAVFLTLATRAFKAQY